MITKIKDKILKVLYFLYDKLKQPSTIVGIIWVIGTLLGKDAIFLNNVIIGVNLFLGGALVGYTHIDPSGSST